MNQDDIKIIQYNEAYDEDTGFRIYSNAILKHSLKVKYDSGHR